MGRSDRAKIAGHTLEVLKSGEYVAPTGAHIPLAAVMAQCIADTRHYQPADLERLLAEVSANAPSRGPAIIELENETTLVGIDKLVSSGATSVAALNFASARNPGGGFLGGSQAQEESLARSSGLYPSLTSVPDFYQQHRRMSSLLYTDAMIHSPGCPVIRDDEGNLLEQPQLVGFITSAAPNAGAVADNHPADLPSIPDVLFHRAELVLALAAHHGYENLVLGAWGCGVFRNDPRVVAHAFSDLLRNRGWGQRFAKVRFSVFDSSRDQGVYRAFEAEFSI